MSEENISQELILENIGKTRSYLIKEINQNKLISMKKSMKKIVEFGVILNTYLC